MTVVDISRRSYTWLRLAAVAGVMLGCLSSSIGLSAIQRSLVQAETTRPDEANAIEERAANEARSQQDEAAARAATEAAAQRQAAEDLERARMARVETKAPASSEPQPPAKAPAKTAPATTAPKSANVPRGLPAPGDSGRPRGVPPPVVVAPPPPMAPPPPPMAVRSFIMFFAFNDISLTAEADAVIREAASIAKEGGASRIVVIGHTDTAEGADTELSLRRARAVKAELVRQGVPESAIVAEGRADRELLVATPMGTREPQNRRVTIDIRN